MESNTRVTKRKSKPSFWIPNSLAVVCEAIEKGCETPVQYPLNSQFNSLLKTLDYIERSFVANYFCQLPWNVSSVRVLGSLNRLRILTATEYMLRCINNLFYFLPIFALKESHSQTDDEHVQLVLNDFLETEFDLLANLIICGYFDLMIGSNITEYVDESIRRLFTDLAKDPKLNNLEYLYGIKGCIPRELHTKLINNHLAAVLSMHKSSMQAAFECFSGWVNQNLDDYVLVNNFYIKGVSGNDLDIVKTLFNMSTNSQFNGWKNYLLLLGLITKHCPAQCGSFIKKWLKDRIKVVAELGSKEIMAHLLLSIRIVLLFHENKTDTYATWFKQYVGDMKFVLNATEFKTMIGTLTELVPYETDEEYLQIHVKTPISPPVMCSQICREYKVLCQTRISDVVGGTTVIVIDEDLFPVIK